MARHLKTIRISNNNAPQKSTLSHPFGKLEFSSATEGVETEVEAIKARSVMIKASDSTLQICGAPSGCAISVYDISGKMVGSSTANSAITFIPTSLSSGEIAIVKIGNKSVKVIMR